MKLHSVPVLAVGLALLTPAAARAAEVNYTIKPIAPLFDPSGIIPPDLHFYVGTLNDRGQIAFDAGTPADRYPGAEAEAIFLYTGEKVIRLAEPGSVTPAGKWPVKAQIQKPVSMNQWGDIAFASQIAIGGKDTTATFIRSGETGEITVISPQGSKAANGYQVMWGMGPSPVINNHGDVVFPQLVAPNPNGDWSWLLQLRRADGTLVAVAGVGQEMPGGGKLQSALNPSLNDAGVVGFVGWAAPPAPFQPSGYLWQSGIIIPVAPVNSDVPGGKLVGVKRVYVNNQNASALVIGRLNDEKSGPDALFRFSGGALSAAVLPGREMPGGGKFRGLQPLPDPKSIGLDWDPWSLGVSWANELGQHAFLARLEDGTTAAYRLDPDGQLALIVKTGDTTALGAVTHLGGEAGSWGIGLNAEGQVAVGIRIDNGTATLALLTPPG